MPIKLHEVPPSALKGAPVAFLLLSTPTTEAGGDSDDHDGAHR
jgi:hypothetical protein